jgi:hypothetical protein
MGKVRPGKRYSLVSRKAVFWARYPRKFADDTKLGQRAGTVRDRECMQEALDNLCLLADRWGMQFNVSKCKVMHFGHNNVHQKYWMNGQELMVIEEEVDIGVKVTKNLKPAGQCQKAAKTAQTVLGQLSRAFSYRDRHKTGTGTKYHQ